jgi:hypothetical protein
MDGQLFHLGETRVKGIRLNCCVVYLFGFSSPCFLFNTVDVSIGNFGVLIINYHGSCLVGPSCGLLEYDEPFVFLHSIVML